MLSFFKTCYCFSFAFGKLQVFDENSASACLVGGGDDGGDGGGDVGGQLNLLHRGGDHLAGQLEEEEDECEEGSAQEVPHGSEVGDGAVVRVDVPGPEEHHEDPADVEEQRDLEEGGPQVGHYEERSGGGEPGHCRADEESEEEVARHHQHHQQAGREGVRLRLLVGVELSRHPGGLHCHQVPAHPVHHRLEDGDTVEGVEGEGEYETPRTAEQHGEDDGAPAVQEDGPGGLVTPGQPPAGRGQQEEEADQERRQPGVALRHVGPQRVWDPGEQGQGGEVSQAGGYGGGHVVRVDVAVAGAHDHGHHHQAQHEAGEAGRHHGAGAHEEAVVEVEDSVLEIPEAEAGEAGEETDDDGLALDESQVRAHQAQAVRQAVHPAHVGRCGQPAGQSHLQVALQPQQSRDEDEELRDLEEDGPVLDDGQDFPGRHHAQSGQQEGEGDLRESPQSHQAALASRSLGQLRAGHGLLSHVDFHCPPLTGGQQGSPFWGHFQLWFCQFRPVQGPEWLLNNWQ